MSRLLGPKVAVVAAIAGVVLAIVFAAYHLGRERGAPTVAAVPVRNDVGFAEPGAVHIGGPFTLEGRAGSTVTDEDFRGRYLLVYFGYARCPDICPTTLTVIARVLDLLGDQAAAVQPLFISVDAKRDTPASVAQFVARFDPRIVGLTGSKPQVDKVVTEYGAFYEEDAVAQHDLAASSRAADGATHGDDYLVSHSRYVYLMSTRGDYLTRFKYGTRPEEMAATVRKAIATFGGSKNTG